VRDALSPEALAVMAIKTGTDMVVFSNIKENDPQLGTKLHGALVQAVCDGTLSRARIENAYGHVMQLKRRLRNKKLAATRARGNG
jgi:hypothetical protein